MVVYNFICSFGFTLYQQDGYTALHAASQEGYCEVVNMLLEAKADVNLKDNVRLS